MPYKILIIDDDPMVHKIIGIKLKSLGSFCEVVSVMDPLKALDFIASFQPDLVVLDLMMPRMSGIEICQRIKADPRWQSVMVLILSAKEGQTDRIKGLEIGADEYVSKPFHVSSLVRKIEYMLEKKKADAIEQDSILLQQ